ncbi:MAG: hypothetical protein Q4F18_14455 [Clostridia bacterium]|nr:hypothetical protein [Clostridia bacterium]
MTGLREGWQRLPRVRVRAATTSASGSAREDIYDAIPLEQALSSPARVLVRARSADGLSLVLSAADAQNAFLAPIEDGWLLILPLDTTRRRWLKHPISFAVE